MSLIIYDDIEKWRFLIWNQCFYKESLTFHKRFLMLAKAPLEYWNVLHMKKVLFFEEPRMLPPCIAAKPFIWDLSILRVYMYGGKRVQWEENVKKGKAQVQRHQYGQKYNGCSDGGKGSLYHFCECVSLSFIGTDVIPAHLGIKPHFCRYFKHKCIHTH